MVSRSHPLNVSVTTLAGFACREGDLVVDGVAGPSSAQGIAAHKRVQKELLESTAGDSNVEVEVALSCRSAVAGRDINFSGRLDWVDHSRPCLGEIKTTLVPPEHLPDSQKSLHWAQLYLYGYIFLQQSAADEQRAETLELCLLHTNIRANETHRETRKVGVNELYAYAERALGVYLAWIDRVDQCAQAMLSSARALSFPFENYRQGQRDMAAAVFRACRDGQSLVCEAPTGIGKTISSLYPAIRSMGEGQLEQIVYLTAKVAGRLSASRALMQLQRAGLVVNAIEIRSKQSSCFCANGRCERDENGRCPMAVGFYDRLPAARDELLSCHVAGADTVEDIAWQHQVCPFELMQQMLPWVHVVIADYNYVFDPLVRLPHFSVAARRTVLLIDEAHNLVDRSRQMFSARLSSKPCKNLAAACRQSSPLIADRLLKLATEIGIVTSGGAQGGTEPDGIRSRLLDKVSAALEPLFEALNKTQATSSEEAITVFRMLCRFLVIGELYGERHRCIFDADDAETGQGACLTLYCVDASAALATQYSAYRSVVLFSASLRPGTFFRDALGLPDETSLLQLHSPFDSSRAYLAVVGWIDTRYRQRESSLHSLVDLIASATSHKPGNYIVYFPSYGYLSQTHSLFSQKYPDIETWLQEREHGKTEQRQQLDRLGGAGHRVGFAIQGGVFGEGIDYIGDLLIGVVIVGTGLPAIDVASSMVFEHYQHQGRKGFDFTYRYPGFTRVLQTAGRLIRDESDRGIILLVDDRFQQMAYRRLYPSHWKLNWPKRADVLDGQIAEFWEKNV